MSTLPSENLILLNNVCKDFDTPKGKITVLQHINLTVNKGEKVCIVGPSGCGKTTILNMIAGFLQPSSGEVSINGKKVVKPGPDRTVVFQKDSVFPWLTVRKNLEYGPKVRGLPRSEWESKIDFYLEKVKLTEFADRYPKELSGGMRKRVDIARAYINSPEILLMDEPFGPLDVMTKEVMQKDLLDLTREENKSIIFITHDIEEAVFLGDRVIVMTARPAKIHSDIKIPFPKDRDPSLKMEPEFQRLRKQIDGIFKGVEQE
ncbi:ABC transporter ATP-binding protein [Pseudogracilibacillus auburnensis]|uniref:ABC transporter ATP-binding protein n=1 Tax=Pseudogracilibacillus auburnensis TaxID=1494959 RepID=UPI0027DAAC0B|nr:ABC transporter ATP-binding protein [Pseudogracilibacillus auburnensis]